MLMAHCFLRERLLLLALAAGAGCHNRAHGPAAGDGDADGMGDMDMATASCASDARVTAWQPGLTAKGGQIAVTVVATKPPGAQAAGTDPPTMGKNAITVQVRNASGSAVDGAQVDLVASMPDHAHGPATAHARAAADTYVFDPLDLFMPGVWKLDFTVMRAGQADEVASLTLCIAG